MILLTFNAAIFHKITSTFLEFDVVHCCGAASGTNLIRL
jgi:hypothetical protein